MKDGGGSSPKDARVMLQGCTTLKEELLKVVVITGSSRGIGFALADAFLARGCAVVLCSRRKETLDEALRRLEAKYAADRVAGWLCDVTQESQHQSLWNQAIARFGHVDLWINNAGQGHGTQRAWDGPAELPRAVLETNLLGAIYGSRVAVRGMLAQGHGAIFNMEGMGSGGERRAGLVYYGTSKYGLRYFHRCLAEDTRGSPLVVGTLNPGMVMTEMITGQYVGRPEEWDRVKRIFDVIADQPEPVANWLADRMLRNRKRVVALKYGTTGRIAGRALRRLWRRVRGGEAGSPVG
jgi:NAD(P)-dependent dehydrogenase (short-subunit alcohol dehydrogenase family)